MSGEFMSVDPSRLGGNLITENFHTLGEYSGLGVGSIDPAQRTDVDPEKYRALLEDLARGEFNVPVERGIDYVKWCIDGRTREGGIRELAPNSAGGSISYVYARAMTPSGLIVLTTDLELASSEAKLLNSKDIEMGVHDAHGDVCACGACAQAESATGIIISHAGSVRQALIDQGIQPSDEQHERVISGTRRLHDGTFFTQDRSAVIDAMVDERAEKELLVGPHLELAIALQCIPGQTIDRQAIRDKYGEQYDVFVLDAWALEKSASLINRTGYEEETADLTTALAYYNIGVAAQLVGPSMPIVPIIENS